MIDMEYRIYIKYLQPCPLPIFLFNKSILLFVSVCEIAEWVANGVDPDQTPRSAASDLGLHSLLKSVCPNT